LFLWFSRGSTILHWNDQRQIVLTSSSQPRVRVRITGGM
jgi:hypothetical protein